MPYLINLPGQGHRVRGELSSVTDRGLAPIHQFKGVAVGHYERLPIRVVSDARRDQALVSAEAYFAPRSFGETLMGKGGFGESIRSWPS